MNTIKEICQCNGDKIIFVNIKRSYNALKQHDINNEYYRPNIEECTRKYWSISKLHLSDLQNATHILGCVGGIVKCTIKIESYQMEENGKYCGRYIFWGSEQSDSPYLNQDIHTIFNDLRNFIHPKYYGF